MSEYKNIGLLFNKHYFKGLSFQKGSSEDEELLKVKNTVLLNSKFEKKDLPVLETNFSFCLRTVYPGLYSGSGYAHESSVTGEIKLGFFFDHTSGMPCIPGSSVKGVLRSAFPDEHAESVLEKKINREKDDGKKLEQENELKIVKEINKAKEEYIKSILGEENVSGNKLKDEIFEGENINSIYQRDIFFDAFPISTKTGFLANDFITPHENPLKDPVPLQFLKVLPQVDFQFQFKLFDSEEVSAEKKAELFKQILLDLGIGAKTNVGYGQFIDPEADLIRLEDVQEGDRIECKVDKKFYRANDDRYQIYLIPGIKDYEDLVSSLKKPLPSIRLKEYEQKKISEGSTIICTVKKILDDGRLTFEYQ